MKCGRRTSSICRRSSPTTRSGSSGRGPRSCWTSGRSFVLSNEMLRGEPTPEALWDHVVRSMAHPGPRDPMRPSVVEVSDSDCYDFLKPKLDRSASTAYWRTNCPNCTISAGCSRRATAAPRNVRLADGPRVTMEQMESFYYAAARYFQQAPWKHVRGEIPIEIRCRGLDVGTRYAVVLGRTGVTLGLALHQHLG